MFAYNFYNEIVTEVVEYKDGCAIAFIASTHTILETRMLFKKIRLTIASDNVKDSWQFFNGSHKQSFFRENN